MCQAGRFPGEWPGDQDLGKVEVSSEGGLFQKKSGQMAYRCSNTDTLRVSGPNYSGLTTGYYNLRFRRVADVK